MNARSLGSSVGIQHQHKGVRIEDSYLTRIPNHGEDTVYWETLIESTLEDYKSVDGILIAHRGRSVVTLFRFGAVAMSQIKTRMEEVWTITEVALNVQGVFGKKIIPPSDIRANPISEAWELPTGERGKGGGGRSRVGALEKPLDDDSVIWRVEV